READMKRTAVALVSIYLMVCSTPLIYVLYARTAWLAVIGLLVLFGFGWKRLSETTTPLKRWGWSVIVLALSITVVMNVGGEIIYPRFKDRIEARFLELQKRNATFDEAPALRTFQIANFPREMTFRN